MREPHLYLLFALTLMAVAAMAHAAPARRAAPEAAASGLSAPAAPHAPQMGDAPGPGDDDLAMLDDGDGPGPDDDALAADIDGPGGSGGPGMMPRRMRGEGEDGGMGGRPGGRHFGRGGMRGPGGPGMHRGGPGGPFMLFAQLDLTDAQKEKLRDIHERQMRSGIQARADLEIARLDMHKLMSAETPDAGAINAQIDKVANLRSEQAKARVAAFMEARALLTPEQLKKAHELRQQGPGFGGPCCAGGPGACGKAQDGHAPKGHESQERGTKK